MKPIEFALLHRICVLSPLMCACQHCNINLFHFIEHTEVADEFITSKNPHVTWFFIIKPRHPSRLKKQVWVEKARSGTSGHMRKHAYYTVTLSERLKVYCRVYCYAVKTNSRVVR